MCMCMCMCVGVCGGVYGLISGKDILYKVWKPQAHALLTNVLLSRGSENVRNGRKWLDFRCNVLKM